MQDIIFLAIFYFGLSLARFWMSNFSAPRRPWTKARWRGVSPTCEWTSSDNCLKTRLSMPLAAVQNFPIMYMNKKSLPAHISVVCTCLSNSLVCKATFVQISVCTCMHIQDASYDFLSLFRLLYVCASNLCANCVRTCAYPWCWVWVFILLVGCLCLHVRSCV